VFWLGLTVLFANLAEAVAGGRGKPSRTREQVKADTVAHSLRRVVHQALAGITEEVPAPLLRGRHRGGHAGEVIPRRRWVEVLHQVLRIGTHRRIAPVIRVVPVATAGG